MDNMREGKKYRIEYEYQEKNIQRSKRSTI